jgi:hypothetical protein
VQILEKATHFVTQFRICLLHIFRFSRHFRQGTKMPKQRTNLGGKGHVYRPPNSRPVVLQAISQARIGDQAKTEPGAV